MTPFAIFESTPASVVVDGWAIERRESVDSTQRAAASWPAWSALVADYQTAGRGQYERTFTSDRGGFYLTAVLPYAGDAARWRGFALAVGLAVHDRLRALGYDEVRLRWPNDLLIGRHKIGGILVEQGARDTLLVGLGLNVCNAPWDCDPSLDGVAGRLADVPGVAGAEPGSLLEPMLAAIRWAHEVFKLNLLAGLVTRINGCWHGMRTVELVLTTATGTTIQQGNFVGINLQGEVLVGSAADGLVAIPAHRIRQLREL